jgi:hypothetical protein
MHTHVKILAILQIVGGTLGLLAAVGLLLLFGGIASMVGINAANEEAMIAVPIIGGIGLFVSAFAALVSIPSIIAGAGLLSYKPWARLLTLVLSGIQLINVPIGTALGFYGFWVLLSKEGASLFEQPTPASYGYTRG